MLCLFVIVESELVDIAPKWWWSIILGHLFLFVILTNDHLRILMTFGHGMV